MESKRQSIFREKALEKYLRKQEQTILLRLASPPMFAFFWILLLLLLGAGFIAWQTRVPISVTAQGIVMEQGATGQAEGQVMAVLFLSPGQQASIHQGEPAQISISSTSTLVTSTVASVETQVISPSEARTRFNLQGGLAQVITGPSVLVTIPIEPAASAHLYAGSLCSASIQIGSRSLLSLLPGFNKILT